MGQRADCGRGRAGEIYNIGANRSLPNREVVGKILAGTGKPDSLIQSVADRPGHDRRYALSSEKLMRETGWAPLVNFEDGLARTIDWYRTNTEWVDRARTGPTGVLRTELRAAGLKPEHSLQPVVLLPQYFRRAQPRNAHAEQQQGGGFRDGSTQRRG